MSDVVETPDMPVTLTIGGVECELHPLSIGDRFAIAARMRDEKLTAFLSLVENKPLLPDVISNTMAKIMTTPVSNVEILTTAAGQVYMILYSLRRGNRKITLDSVLKMPPLRMKLFLEIIDRISNYGEAEDESDPTASTSGSSTSSEAVASGAT